MSGRGKEDIAAIGSRLVERLGELRAERLCVAAFDWPLPALGKGRGKRGKGSGAGVLLPKSLHWLFAIHGAAVAVRQMPG